MDALEPKAEFRREVRAAAQEAFSLHGEIARTLADEAVRPRHLPHERAEAIEMIMQQGWQAHASVAVLLERLFFKDAIVITRRLLELSIQAAYILAPATIEEQSDRARRFLARLWFQTPERLRQALLSEHEISRWESCCEDWRRNWPANPRKWWPRFYDMFDELGLETTYETDKRYLSSASHGLPWLALGEYASTEASSYRYEPLALSLHWSNSYYIAIAFWWNQVFGCLDDDILWNLRARSESIKKTPNGPMSWHLRK